MRLSVIAVLMGALAACALALLFLLPRPSSTAELDLMLQEVDAAVAEGRFAEARESIKALRSLPPREEDCLRLMKRLFTVSRATAEYALLDELTGRALAAHGRSERVRALAVYAALRNDRLSAAERYIGKGLGRSERGDMLAGEAALKRGREWAGCDALTRDLLSLESKADPAAYASAAERTGDVRLSLDAALMCMEAGLTVRARGIAEDELAAPRFDEPAAYILYDAGEYAQAVERLIRVNASRPERPEIMLVLADACAGAGRKASAEKWLLAALPLAPELSWTPYANLAFLSMGRGNRAAAAKHLEHGLAFFPRNRSLRLAQARLALSGSDTDTAQSILEGLTAENPADADAALLLLSLQERDLSPPAYRARLWKLFERVPADSSVFAILCNALLAAHDWEGAGIAVTQHRAARGEARDGTIVIEGLIAAMQGRTVDALGALRRAADVSKDGLARYDLALVLLSQGNARDAREAVEEAIEEYGRNGGGGQRGIILSRMETVRAAALILDGDDQAARIALGHALRHDPHNLRAGLFIRKLDAKGQ